MPPKGHQKETDGDEIYHAMMATTKAWHRLSLTQEPSIIAPLNFAPLPHRATHDDRAQKLCGAFCTV
jgi:hypothetical protein